jgi:CDP-diacylglycerol--serine O-phosphatidyltransferase
MNGLGRSRRPRVSVRRRAVVFLPNGFTLFNLFCGIYAIVLAARQEFPTATLFVVIGGFADILDGRVARATGTGSRFGEELDSLVDAISFGLAPALIMYFAVLNRSNWEWLLIFIFTSCAVMRLARFNVEQAGRKKTHFHGLPSPAAGMTLASYYWFSQTSLYNQTVILFTDSKTLADLPWHKILSFLMAVLAALMISEVPYPAVPTIGFRSVRQMIGSAIVLGCIAGLIFLPRQFIFPALLVYVLFGAVKWVTLGFIGRSRSPDDIFWEEEPNGSDAVPPTAEARAVTRPSDELAAGEPPVAFREVEAPRRDEHAQSRRRRRRRGRGSQPRGPGGPPSGSHKPAPPPNPPRDTDE